MNRVPYDRCQWTLRNLTSGLETLLSEDKRDGKRVLVDSKGEVRADWNAIAFRWVLREGMTKRSLERVRRDGEGVHMRPWWEE